MGGWRVGGLDLAASERRCSGLAVIDPQEHSLEDLVCLSSDSEILERVLLHRARVLAVDAPLIEVPKFREVDREAMRRGFRVIPPTLGPMRALTARAWRLYTLLEARGVTVIETHPTSALRSSGARDVVELSEALGVSIEGAEHLLSRRDLRDALISALVALCYVRGDCVNSIRAPDGAIFVISRVRSRWP